MGCQAYMLCRTAHQVALTMMLIGVKASQIMSVVPIASKRPLGASRGVEGGAYDHPSKARDGARASTPKVPRLWQLLISSKVSEHML
jgi:hypothetical protein